MNGLCNHLLHFSLGTMPFGVDMLQNLKDIHILATSEWLAAAQSPV